MQIPHTSYARPDGVDQVWTTRAGRRSWPSPALIETTWSTSKPWRGSFMYRSSSLSDGLKISRRHQHSPGDGGRTHSILGPLRSWS